MKKHRLYLYFMDLFKPLNISLADILELAERNPLALFNTVKKHIEQELGDIKDVKVYKRYFNPERMDIVVEYFVECKMGEVSVKLVYTDNLSRTLEEYYRSEKKSSFTEKH